MFSVQTTSSLLLSAAAAVFVGMSQSPLQGLTATTSSKFSTVRRRIAKSRLPCPGSIPSVLKGSIGIRGVDDRRNWPSSSPEEEEEAEEEGKEEEEVVVEGRRCRQH